MIRKNTLMSSKPTKTSVTNFLYHEDEYLFIKRNSKHKIMPSQVNGIGGKLEKGEDYVSAAIRETKEETGYEVDKKDIKFCGIIKFENKRGDDWVTCFFKIKVPDKNIPAGTKNDEGRLFWSHKGAILSSKYKLADDLNYVFEDIVEGKSKFFLTIAVEDNNFKIVKCKSHRLF
jgi:8-oxo-dGTP pyrophosphatase MutT (NUDIX family)